MRSGLARLQKIRSQGAAVVEAHYIIDNSFACAGQGRVAGALPLAKCRAGGSRMRTRLKVRTWVQYSQPRSGRAYCITFSGICMSALSFNWTDLAERSGFEADDGEVCLCQRHWYVFRKIRCVASKMTPKVSVSYTPDAFAIRSAPQTQHEPA